MQCIRVVGSIMMLSLSINACRINCLIKANTVIDCSDTNTNHKECKELRKNHLEEGVVDIIFAKFSIVNVPINLQEYTALKSVKIRHFLGNLSGCEVIRTQRYVKLN